MPAIKTQTPTTKAIPNSITVGLTFWRILAKATNTDQQEAAQTYALWIEQKTLSQEGETTPGAVKAMIDALLATKQLKEPLAVERVADFSYLDRVRKAEGGK